MDEYIEKSKITDFCNDVIASHGGNSGRERVARAFDNFKAYVESIPAADVVPVVHGKWRWTETGDEDYEQFWVCSVCGEKSYWQSNYCPECGAKMDGGADNDVH